MSWVPFERQMCRKFRHVTIQPQLLQLTSNSDIKNCKQLRNNFESRNSSERARSTTNWKVNFWKVLESSSSRIWALPSWKRCVSCICFVCTENRARFAILTALSQRIIFTAILCSAQAAIAVVKWNINIELSTNERGNARNASEFFSWAAR